MRLSKLAKSIIREIDLAGWVNSVNDGDCERGEVIKKFNDLLLIVGFVIKAKMKWKELKRRLWSGLIHSFFNIWLKVISYKRGFSSFFVAVV